MVRPERGAKVGEQIAAHLPTQVTETVQTAIEEIKPHLRGWLHAVTSPLTVAAGIVLIVLSPTTTTRIGSTVFTLTSALLFTVSAVYHRGTWGPRAHRVLMRLDHANIFL